MSVVSGPPRAVYAAAVETLAGRVVGALTGANDAFRLAEVLPPETRPADRRAGLAAVRVLGADALAPFWVAGHQFSPDDAEVVAMSIRTFPLPELDSSASDDYAAETATWVRVLREWATGEVLTRLGESGYSRPYPVRAGAGGGRERGWVAWAGMLAALSPLAVPGLDSALHADVQCYRLDVARGVTRALLRRDHLTAARLVRWLVVCHDGPMDPPFAVEPVVRHLELVAEPDPRLRLELTMARSGLGVEFDD
ncbi:MAG TPA: hypothetical protein VJ757_11495 [Pseudonocardiaceae bacterium]|nr:hypothetical protein [Pseudonocardiaceae bacterium]